MKLKGLRKRAQEVGVDDQRLEDAMDSEDLCGAVIALLMEHAPGAGA